MNKCGACDFQTADEEEWKNHHATVEHDIIAHRPCHSCGVTVRFVFRGRKTKKISPTCAECRLKEKEPLIPIPEEGEPITVPQEGGGQTNE